MAGGILNSLGFGASGQDTQSEDALKDAAARFNIPLPQLKQLALQNPNWQKDLEASTVAGPGQVSYKDAATQQAQATQQGDTAMADINVDPRLKAQQAASLGALQDLAQRGGMNQTDQANLARIQGQTNQADAGRRGAIMESQDRRGMGGSGMDLMAQLASSQAATTQQSQAGLDVAGQAQQRALDAMMQSGQMAGQQRSQDYGEQANLAGARDSINRFNTQNANQMSMYNATQGNEQNRYNAGNQLTANEANVNNTMSTDRFNAGQTQNANQFNTAGRQAVSDAGTANDNSAARFNQGLPQQQFGNQTALAAHTAAADTRLSDYYGQKSAERQRANQAVIQGAARIGAAAATGGGSEVAGAALSAAQPKPAAEVRADKENSGDMSDTGAYAQGGIIPGRAAVPGDSSLNDSLTAHVSPGEAIIPRTAVAKLGGGNNLAKIIASLKGSSGGTPPVGDPANSTPDMHGAMMAALKHLSKKG